MDGVDKLRLMGQYMNSEVTDTMDYHLAADSPGCQPQGKNPSPGRRMDTHSASVQKEKSFPIHFAAMPGGKRIALLKTALTTACERNCNYCAFRCGRDFNRQTFSVDELAKTFMQLKQAGMVEGLFLSSGIAGGGMKTQDRLLACAEILRRRFDFKGYIHLKIMPGADKDQVVQAMQFADRVSVNLESPTTLRLQKLAPQKKFLEELLAPLKWVEEIRREYPAWKGWNGRWPSSTTQFVVGAIDETDLELLQVTSFLHKDLHLSRVYYSGFEPVSGTPLENQSAIHPLRQVRLYQSDFLLRDYGFDFEELEFSRSGFLPLEMDPKMIWANNSLRDCPLEINKADYHQLIRVPGIGQVNARRIMEQRKCHFIRDEADLHRLGISVQRAAPFILLNGKRPVHQLPLQFNIPSANVNNIK
ncbi:MAG: radical SAM protein [Chloroflexi bacterium]|nr:radical SAM protein [Chloroflexota bacterium]